MPNNFSVKILRQIFRLPRLSFFPHRGGSGGEASPPPARWSIRRVRRFFAVEGPSLPPKFPLNLPHKLLDVIAPESENNVVQRLPDIDMLLQCSSILLMFFVVKHKYAPGLVRTMNTPQD